MMDLDKKYPLLPAESCSYAWAVVADWKNEGPPTSEPIIWCASEELAEKVQGILNSAKQSDHNIVVEEKGTIHLVGEDSIVEWEVEKEWVVPIYGVEGWEFRFFYNVKEGVAQNGEIAFSIRDALDKIQC